MIDHKYDQESLRQLQLDYYNAHKDDPTPPIVDDRNPPGTERNYRALRNVWMPLILDQVGKEPWTLEEILSAMTPIVKKFAMEYGGKRPSFQPDEAESEGYMALLHQLATDKGIAPFASHAAANIKRAIMRGLRQSSIVRKKTRDETYTDSHVTSADIPSEVGGKYTVGNSLGSDAKAPEKLKCPACAGTGSVDEITCDVCRGEGSIGVNVERSMDPHKPDDILAGQEQLTRLSSTVQDLFENANLSPRMKEIMLLMFGVESIFGFGLKNTYRPPRETETRKLKGANTPYREPTQIARILSAADEILQRPNLNAMRADVAEQDQGIWPYAVKFGRENEFHDAWERVFTQATGDSVMSFNPDLPVSLQIAPLAGDGEVEDNIDTLLVDLRASVFLPEHLMAYVKSLVHEAMELGAGDINEGVQKLNAQGKLPDYMVQPVLAVHAKEGDTFNDEDAAKAAEIPTPVSRSKQLVVNLYKKAWERLNKTASSRPNAADEFLPQDKLPDTGVTPEPKPEPEMPARVRRKAKPFGECVDIMRKLSYDITLDMIERGTADPEDIDIGHL